MRPMGLTRGDSLPWAANFQSALSCGLRVLNLILLVFFPVWASIFTLRMWVKWEPIIDSALFFTAVISSLPLLAQEHAQKGIQRGDIGLPDASENIHVIPGSYNVSSLPRNLWETGRGPSLPQSTDVLWLSTNYLSSWPKAGLSRSSALDCLHPSKTWIASAQSNYSYWLCFHEMPPPFLVFQCRGHASTLFSWDDS